MVLLGKWGWRFASERDFLWKRVIVGMFGEEGGGGGWKVMVLAFGKLSEKISWFLKVEFASLFEMERESSFGWISGVVTL